MLQNVRRTATLTATFILVALVATASAQERIDRALREGRHQSATQRVIIKAKPGYASWVRHLLAQRGNEIYAELPSIDAVAAELSSLDLDAVCLHSVAAGCAIDAVVSPSARRQLLLPVSDNYFCRRRVSEGASPTTGRYSVVVAGWLVAG